ncbi:MAG: SAM-dependent DNA methyltransferase [Bacteroidales bacterium]|nr:SAM-dependent DNA methyltransferase [Bacteroidales bacterium]
MDIVSFIWNIADDCLRDVFQRGQYRDVILPMVVLRRFDALLEDTKTAVLDEVKSQKQTFGDGTLDEEALTEITGYSFFNTSKWTLSRIKNTATDNNKILCDNFVEYINAFSSNVKEVLKKFEFEAKAKRLADSDRLLSVIEKITDRHINLTNAEALDPDGLPLPPVSNIEMGRIFEELLRRFNEENNEEAGEHFTPRDAIHLLARLVFEPVLGNLPKIISIYDPAEGSGGMLTESFSFLEQHGIDTSAIQLFGTEINPETYAICKSDLIIKGVPDKGMHNGNTISEDHFGSQTFGYMITNPPYGKSWKTEKERLYHDGNLLDKRFELTLADFAGEEQQVDCTPRSSDGQLLFILEEVNKMKPLDRQPQGSRVASIHNGSSLFTGDAGSGESNTRRYLIENDLVEAIIQLPNNIFYNTGISTYVWLMTNHKAEKRRGKVQLIDASQAYEKLRKNQGNRNCTITDRHSDKIVKTFMDFVESDDPEVRSKIFLGDDFRYYNTTIERPLRLRSQFTALKCDELLFEQGSNRDLYVWLYQTYGDKVFEGLSDKVSEVKAYFEENELKVTDKQRETLLKTDKWKERRLLKDTATALMHKIGTEVFMDYNIFIKKVKATAKAIDAKISDAALKKIARAMSETDPEAAPVVKKTHKANSKDIDHIVSTFGVKPENIADYGFILSGKNLFVEYEPDTNLRDTEKIPVKEDIYEYFLREVRPYVADAWIDIASTKIGCEISFNKYFYKPAPLRTLEENERDIIALDKESQGFIQSLFDNL